MTIELKIISVSYNVDGNISLEVKNTKGQKFKGILKKVDKETKTEEKPRSAWKESLDSAAEYFYG